jgi:hypothetical protein
MFAPVLFLALAAPPTGYQAQVKVTAPTRLDWTFVLTNQSLAEPPADWLGDYQSTSQTFELYVPPRRDPKQALPAILFISAGDGSAWKSFEPASKKLGFVFIGVLNAGNSCPPKKRVRIILDAFDEARRQVPLDPDRTYVAGLSGGARMANAVGFALPESFGGILSIVAGGDPREESWLRQRAADRLSVALLTGQSDFNRNEVEKLRTPFLKDVGIRARVWTQPGLGHGMPSDATLQEALRWLEEAAPKRRELGKTYPASRMAGDAAPGRAELAKELFKEGKERLEKPASLYAGLMLMKGVMERWPDLPEAKQAEKLLLEYEARKEKPWEADDLAEQRRYLIAKARALDAYAVSDLPKEYAKEKPSMLKGAITFWKQVQQDGPDTAPGREAAKRIPELEKLLSSSEK